jgi:hypothetical protein
MIFGCKLLFLLHELDLNIRVKILNFMLMGSFSWMRKEEGQKARVL